MARENANQGTKTAAAKPEQSNSSDGELPTLEAESTEITIYPLRSYLDGKEIRRAGGEGYKSPKHDAVSLIAAGLATDTKPKT